MTLVVDASVAAKWVLPEPDSDAAERVLFADDTLIAPDFLLVEVANTFWKVIRRGEMTDEEAQAALHTLRNGLTYHPVSSLLAGALRLAQELDHPIYDCLYVVLAEQENARLVTADRQQFDCLMRSDLRDRALWLHDVV